MSGKLKVAVVAGMTLAIMLVGCGGGQKISMPAEGVQLSYKPAVGKTFTYRAVVKKYIQTSEKGVSIEKQVSGDVTFDVSVLDAGEGGKATMKYKFKNVAVSVFQNNQIQPSDEVEDLKDLEFTVYLDTSGSMDSLEGIDLEEEFQKKEISPIDFLLTFPIPQEKVKIGYSWENVQDTTVQGEHGTATQKVKVTYNISDFVMLDSARCVVADIKGTIHMTQKGESEDEDGTVYEIDMTMDGDIKGKIYFDVDNGCVVKYQSNKMVDVKGTQTNTDTGEQQPISYYNQETIDAKLLKK